VDTGYRLYKKLENINKQVIFYFGEHNGLNRRRVLKQGRSYVISPVCDYRVTETLILKVVSPRTELR
jgi:hypothetical protein